MQMLDVVRVCDDETVMSKCVVCVWSVRILNMQQLDDGSRFCIIVSVTHN